MTVARTLDRKNRWKVGDWCFFEFELCQIKRIFGDDGDGYECSNGTTSCSGMLADRMFPLDYKIMQLSAHFEWDDRRLHWESEGFNLNWPDIHRWFAAKWAEACRVKDDDEAVKLLLDEKSKFVRDIREGMRDIRFKTVGGIQAFARR